MAQPRIRLSLFLRSSITKIVPLGTSLPMFKVGYSACQDF
ncbi:Uncharacterised protein [Vibrio cholerae]|nr:Uncharacterised protein [Vibrio cholerae]